MQAIKHTFKISSIFQPQIKQQKNFQEHTAIQSNLFSFIIFVQILHDYLYYTVSSKYIQYTPKKKVYSGLFNYICCKGTHNHKNNVYFDTLWDTLLMKNIKDFIFIIF